MRPTEWTMMMISVQTEFLTHARNISMSPGLDGQGRMENRAEKVPSTEQQTKPGRYGLRMVLMSQSSYTRLVPIV